MTDGKFTVCNLKSQQSELAIDQSAGLDWNNIVNGSVRNQNLSLLVAYCLLHQDVGLWHVTAQCYQSGQSLEVSQSNLQSHNRTLRKTGQKSFLGRCVISGHRFAQ